MREGSTILYASFDRVPAPKGASVHIAQFVRGLSNHFDVTLLTPGDARWEGETLGARHRVVPVEGKNFLRDTESFADAVRGALAKEKFDAAHFRSIWEGVPATELKERGGFKTVYEVNGLPSVELRYHYPAVVKNKALLERFRDMELFALIHADLVIAQSNVTGRHISGRGVNPDKIKVIPNGVDVDLFKPPLAQPPLPVKMLYAGTLAPWQGVAHMLEAFKKATKERDASLTIMGKARKDWLKDLKKRARKLKIVERVEIAEPVRHREMPPIIGGAHIALAPFPATERNTKQGFSPIKVLEYMACARPVIAPDLPAVTELARHQREALLYKPNSMSRMAETMVNLIDDESLRIKLGQGGRERACDLTWKTSRKALIEAYLKL